MIVKGVRSTISDNTIAGNTLEGIWIDGTFAPDTVLNTLVEGNFIGTDNLGNVAHGNGTSDFPGLSSGISINGSAGDTIRRNLISGNEGTGISIMYRTSNITIVSNRIGTNKLVTDAIPNDRGMRLLGSDHIVDGNVISGNTNEGVVAGETIVLGRDLTRTTFMLKSIGCMKVSSPFVALIDTFCGVASCSKTISLKNNIGL